MSNGSSLFMGNGYKYCNGSKCDMCKKTVNEVILLKKERFTNRAEQHEKNYRRVCFGCAGELNLDGAYLFGSYWRKFLLNLKFRYNKKTKKFKKVRNEVLNK